LFKFVLNCPKIDHYFIDIQYIMLSFLSSIDNAVKSRHAGKPAPKNMPPPPPAISVVKKFQRPDNMRRAGVICDECNQMMYVSSLSGTGSTDQAYICSNCGRVEELCGTGYNGGAEEVSEAISAIRMEAMNDNSVENAGGRTAATSSVVADPTADPGSIKKIAASANNYKRQQLRTTVEQMTNFMYQYDGPKLPANVVADAADMYFRVQQYCIKRGEVRKGTMAACLYRKCKEAQINRKPKEIAVIFGISQSELSNGEKILDDLYAKGCLKDIGTKLFQFDEQSHISSFLDRYFELFNLPAQYKIFAERLIRFTEKYHIVPGSIVSSKCAGAIYLITNKLPELGVTTRHIVAGCRISKSTFTRFYVSIQETLNGVDPAKDRVRSRLRRIFKKNGVPLPF
jgi:transcription initiation factor TFIIIB Brf1 subunit/transcription initiation factor TFIIB